MTQKLEIYDLPMCCPTGVCGPFVDPALMQFASDIAWLHEQGISVERYNLSQQPDVFAKNNVLKKTIEKEGIGCLPLIIVNNAVVAKGHYPGRKDLACFAGIEC